VLQNVAGNIHFASLVITIVTIITYIIIRGISRQTSKCLHNGRKEGKKGKLRRGGNKQPNDNIPHALQCSQMPTETLIIECGSFLL
jgi:hypothetical protein